MEMKATLPIRVILVEDVPATRKRFEGILRYDERVTIVAAKSNGLS